MSLAAILSSSPFAVTLLLVKLAALAGIVAWALVRLLGPRAAPCAIPSKTTGRASQAPAKR